MAKKKKPEQDPEMPEAQVEVDSQKSKTTKRLRKIIAAAASLVSLFAAGAGTIFAYKKITSAASEAARKLARERGDDIAASDIARAAFEQLSGIPLTEIEAERIQRAKANEELNEQRAMEFRSKMEQRRLKSAMGAFKEVGKERSKRMEKVQALQEKREERMKREVLGSLKEAVEEGGARRLVIEAAAKAGAERMKQEFLTRQEPQPMSGVEELREVSDMSFEKSDVRTRPSVVEPMQRREAPPMRKGSREIRETTFEPAIPRQARPQFADTMDIELVPVDETPVRPQPQFQRSDISSSQPTRAPRAPPTAAAKKRVDENEAKRQQMLNVESFTRRREAREAREAAAKQKKTFDALKSMGSIRGKTKQIIGPRKRIAESYENDERAPKRVKK